MRLRQIKKIVSDKPYLFDPAYRMSMAEAKKLTRQEGYLPIEETIARAKARSSLPETAWEPVNRLLAKKHRPGSCVVVFVRHHKLAAIMAACFIILMTGFASPTVRAYTIELYQKTVKMIAGKMEIVTPKDDFMSMKEGSTVKIIGDTPTDLRIDEYSSIAELTQKTGLKPYLVLDASGFTLEKAVLQERPGLTKKLILRYRSPDEKAVVITANLEGDGSLYSLPDDGQIWTTLLPTGEEMICSVDPIDGSFSGNVAIDGVAVSVYAEAGIDLNQLRFDLP